MEKFIHENIILHWWRLMDNQLINGQTKGNNETWIFSHKSLKHDALKQNPWDKKIWIFTIDMGTMKI